MIVINTTPHDVHYYDEEGKTTTFAKCGVVLNVIPEPQSPLDIEIDEKRINAATYPKWADLSGIDKLQELIGDPDEAVVLIVSTITAEFFMSETGRKKYMTLFDVLLVPDTSSKFGVRDERGAIIGTTRFQRFNTYQCDDERTLNPDLLYTNQKQEPINLQA